MQKEHMFGNYFPKCLHSVGLFFGNYTKNNTVGELLMTYRYKHHEKIVNGRFSKAMIDVSRAKYKDFDNIYWDTIHNPSRATCGENTPYSVGIDYISSIFKINHYIGSMSIFLKRIN